jgi:hypothetical protein
MLSSRFQDDKPRRLVSHLARQEYADTRAVRVNHLVSRNGGDRATSQASRAPASIALWKNGKPDGEPKAKPACPFWAAHRLVRSLGKRMMRTRQRLLRWSKRLEGVRFSVKHSVGTILPHTPHQDPHHRAHQRKLHPRSACGLSLSAFRRWKGRESEGGLWRLFWGERAPFYGPLYAFIPAGSNPAARR